jgi:hypothetical protein
LFDAWFSLNSEVYFAESCGVWTGIA